MLRRTSAYLLSLCFFVVFILSGSRSLATPANKAALEHHFDKFLSANLARCTTCHLPSDHKDPQSLNEFPHNDFGARLRKIRSEMPDDSRDIISRLKRIAAEDSDGDGIANEKEILLGHNPGEREDAPTSDSLTRWPAKLKDFETFLASYHWRPFQPVKRPTVPRIKDTAFARNAIDHFIAAEHEQLGLNPRPEAAKEVLLKRVYLDIIGLLPTIAEQDAFLRDQNPFAYELLVDKLLDDPRYGERWGRHWMDIWRYSDWGGWSGGNQIRDSQPHIWRWRDWIVESLNANKPYDQMVREMLAGDEIAPEDPATVRATGYLVRNYKMLSREQWLEDTLKHTGQAFLGVTLGCAKCHDHMYDPISQAEYYQVRAIFEPHQVRIDRVRGELDRAKNGLPRVYDTDTNAITYFLLRGDERKPDTNRVMTPGILQALGGRFDANNIALPKAAAFPDRRDFVITETIAASEATLRKAETKLQTARENSEDARAAELGHQVAKTKHDELLVQLKAEEATQDSHEWSSTARRIVQLQRKIAVLEAQLKTHEAQVAFGKSEQKLADATRALNDANETRDTEKEDGTAIAERNKAAEKAKREKSEAEKRLKEAQEKLAEAEKNAAAEPTTDFKPRSAEKYPDKSTGRRLAFAHWIANEQNPPTARVAMNHLWLRHFGTGIVPTPADFGRNGRAPTHPQLLDWLAAEFMSQGWRMKEMHRLILKSSTYRMASTTDSASSAIDPDNAYLWRAPARRMEAELVRDNLLHTAGDLDATMGGPEIDQNLGLTSKRRSIYLRIGPEKEVEFMKIFDGPTITECYVRRPTVNPQQALALHNSELTLREARNFAAAVWNNHPAEKEFIRASFRRLLVREPRSEEISMCRDFLAEQSRGRSPERARENLILVLMNHNDFVTIR
ncbi:MAG TPA: DUF1553 domain-containing protein [Verrucomicrobiae bacterium]